MGDSHALIELDLYVDNVQGVNHSIVKRTRNTWKEEHKLALVNQVYLADCCTIGKRTYKEVNDAWAKLMHALTTRSNGMFDEFNLSIPAVGRQMKELMERQKSMNRDALGATRLEGPECIHILRPVHSTSWTCKLAWMLSTWRRRRIRTRSWHAWMDAQMTSSEDQ